MLEKERFYDRATYRLFILVLCSFDNVFQLEIGIDYAAYYLSFDHGALKGLTPRKYESGSRLNKRQNNRIRSQWFEQDMEIGYERGPYELKFPQLKHKFQEMIMKSINEVSVTLEAGSFGQQRNKIMRNSPELKRQVNELFRLQIRVQDETGTIALSLFNDEVQAVDGRSAYQLVDKYGKLVHYDSSLQFTLLDIELLLQFVFGDTFFCKTNDAVEKFRSVASEGDLFQPGGFMTGGSIRHGGDKLRQLHELGEAYLELFVHEKWLLEISRCKLTLMQNLLITEGRFCNIQQTGGGNEDIKKITTVHMEQYGEAAGLRTLCLAYSDLSTDMYESWNEKFIQAKSSLRDRE
ncbi:P-type ATPase, HAD-like domain protein [Artemisia annua]|uniref:P-type ATPase, HAD-like domain protein n=1 Tax=Artemisia annua TaxID=35608 RepID=A0A2U1MYS6_ARTAN|nr:P-type ATPase, HAD-like domain protein [Artemisia annua]